MSPNWNEFVRRRMPALGLRPEREAEIIAEIAEQMRLAHQEWLDSGHSSEEAIRHAESQVRDWDALASDLRRSEAPAPRPLEPEPRGSVVAGIGHDVRYALRWLSGNPVFALVAILTLAFAIGGNTAIFTVVDHIALRGLPYAEPNRLMAVEDYNANRPDSDSYFSIDNFIDFRARMQAFEKLLAVSPVWNYALTGDGDTERLEALHVSADFFPTLGVTPHIGRAFTAAEDDRARPAAVAMLSYAFWKRRFGGSPAVVGKTIVLDGNGVAVIGVLPEDFRWMGEPLAGTAINPDLWMPMASNLLMRTPRTLRFIKVTGVLKPGVSFEQGADETKRIGAALIKEFPGANGDRVFSAVSLEQKVTKRLRPAVYLLLATVGFVLLMASANVANLLLARAAGRRREISVRIALGASAARLIRQLLTESAVLAVLGGIAGIGLAAALLRLILSNGPEAMLRTIPIALDGRALMFTSGVVIMTTILAGIVPAWRTLAGPGTNALREGRGTTRGNRRVRSLLAVTQVTLAAILLSGSGLLVRSFLRVLDVHPGFNSHNVVSISSQLPNGITTPAQRTNAFNKIRDELLAVPGVQSVGAVSRLPLLGQTLTSLLYIEGRSTSGPPPEVEFRAANPGYFSTMGIPLVGGRYFDERDGTAGPVLIVDEVTARRHFPGENAVGKRIRFLADNNGPWFEIIGVVGAIRHFGIEAEPRPTIYRPAAMNPLGSPVFVIRTAGDPGAMLKTLSGVVRSAYGNMPAYNVYSMDQLVARSTSERQFLMWLTTSFAAAALFLAAIGIYGAISQSVAQRQQEIGVRIALGASPRDTLRLVLGEGLWIAGIGVMLGVALGLGLAKAGERLLYGVKPYDVLVFATAALTLFVSTLAACYLPARRAMKVDPLITLRDA